MPPFGRAAVVAVPRRELAQIDYAIQLIGRCEPGRDVCEWIVFHDDKVAGIGDFQHAGLSAFDLADGRSALLHYLQKTIS